MEFIDYSKTNEFLKHAYDMFEAVYIQNEEKEVEEKYKLLKIIPATRKVPNLKLKNLYADAVYFADHLRNNPPSFDTLFDFGTFVKSIEKVFFYRNDLSSMICCDSAITEKTSRKLIFNINDIIIVIKLDRLNIADEYIDIVITRNFGKKMETKYSIKNSQITYADCNDLMLINCLNNIFENTIADFFMEVIDSIYNKKILSIDTLGQKISCKGHVSKGIMEGEHNE